MPRPSSRPASRPASRPTSILSTALNLSPQILNLGDELITKLTGFAESEENFGICHDFLVSNLLYHTYLEPFERDVMKKCDKLADKWQIQNKTEKVVRFEQLLEQYKALPVFEAEHEQHGLRARLLVLLLALSNSDEIKQDDDNDEESGELRHIIEDIIVESDAVIGARKAQEIRNLLASGEEPPESFSDSELSDWSSDEEDEVAFLQLSHQESPPSSSLPSLSSSKKKALVTHLPGVKIPLKPPQPMPDFEGSAIEVSVLEARRWLSENLMPPYWSEQIDSRALAPMIRVTNPMPDAQYVKAVDADLFDRGLPVTEKLVLPEYQVLYECIWILRNPLCEKSPLFKWNGTEFEPTPNVCLSSVLPVTLASCLSRFRQSLTSLHNLHSFVAETLDRRKDPVGILDELKPPFTYEAYAEALSNVFNLLSADLLTIERKVKDRTETYTLLSLLRDLASWLSIIDSLGSFHLSAVTDQHCKENWEKSLILISALSQALSTCHEPKLFTIFVDLLLKSLSPYFRIIGVWLTQGRFEDYRSEFVYGVNLEPSRVQSPVSDDSGLGQSISYLSTPSESFWSSSFIERPFVEKLAQVGLVVPQMFAQTFPKLLTCGKSVTILTILEKQSILFPGYKSAFTPIQDMVAPTELYDNFLANLKQSLAMHKASHSSSFKTSTIPMLVEGLSLSDLIGDVSDIDPDLIEAYDIIAADLPDFELGLSSVRSQDESEDLVDSDRFLILSDYGLDPMKSMACAMEYAFGPVVFTHTERACSRLVHLFRHSLSLDTHLAYMRRVFFMEAGDLLSEFSSQLFANIAAGIGYDATTLNVLLHDCLCRRFPTEEVEKFCLDIGGESKGNPLESLVLSYSVQWPMNTVLNRQAMEMYNKVFVFLLKVKQALWALLQINAKDLAATINKDDSDAELEEKESKLHRVILLRSWLLHFISNVHDYFMTRVLQSTQLQLMSSLLECQDLDAILDVHERYIKRIYDCCFLHPSASVLREAVFKVLQSAMVLYKFCAAHLRGELSEHFIMDSSTLKSLEEKYAMRHVFLASMLRSMTQNRNDHHLDGLSAALLHSCPSVVS